MPDSANLTLWGTIIGWVVFIFAGGAAWGRHETQLKHLNAVAGNCKMEGVMTEEKCRDFHARSQEVTNAKLNAIEANQHVLKEDWREMARELKQYQIQLGAAASRLENIAGRLEK